MKKKKYGAGELVSDRERNEVVQKAFISEGTMVAFAPCFPGVTVPIRDDECHITALDVSADGMVYGGTSGFASHLLVGMFHGVTGMIFDMGVVECAESCVGVCCGREKVAACVNGEDGGRIVIRELEPLPFDLIQEWQIFRRPFRDLGYVVKGEKIVHAVRDSERNNLVGITEGHLFVVNMGEGKIEIICEVAGRGRIAATKKGQVYGASIDGRIWCYDLKSGRFNEGAFALPGGDWDLSGLTWAEDEVRGIIYTADAEGNIYGFTEGKGFTGVLGSTALGEVGPMAVTRDGRLFGFCGDGIAKMFCYNPYILEVTDLGAAVSVLDRRRYGYVFGDAVVGRDGEIYFGEDDDLGHLWIYYPSIFRA